MKSKFFVFVSSCIYLLSFMTIYNIKNNEYEYKRINLNLKSIGEKCFIESLDFNKSNQSFEIHHNRFELLMNNYISDLDTKYIEFLRSDRKLYNVFENKEIKIDYFSFLKEEAFYSFTQRLWVGKD